MDGTTEENYKIEFVDKILDPVHGFIDLTQVEAEIIALPIFKRLQSLKQLSLTNWVFPGAEHTRYMHSLGVMHIVDLMAIHLKDINGKKRFNDNERQLLRLAGLLHDIGHYPLSHVTEYVYLNNLVENKYETLEEHNKHIKEEIEKLNPWESIYDKETGTVIKQKKTTEIPPYMISRKNKKMHHETMGTKVISNSDSIKDIIVKHCPFINIEEINDIIVGCVENKKLSAMVQLMHSELDADGIDYVMRDATFSGTSYGGFELGLLLRNFVVVNYNGTEIVGIKPKGISIVDQYLVSKYFSYTQVIFNKHVAIFDTMAEMLSKAFINFELSPMYIKADSLNAFIKKQNEDNRYLRFTDRTFWGQIDAFTAKDLEGIVPDHITCIHNRLSQYQEFDSNQGNECIITSSKSGDVYDELIKSDTYANLTKPGNHLALFHKKGFTSELPETEYRRILSSFYETDESLEEHFIINNVSRLQEGIVIIDGSKEPKLLVDDPGSIMSHLYNTNTYIFREYNVAR